MAALVTRLGAVGGRAARSIGRAAFVALFLAWLCLDEGYEGKKQEDGESQVMDKFHGTRISVGGAGSTPGCRCIERLELGGGSIRVGRLIKFAIEGSEKIPASSVFGFELGGPLGVGQGLGVTIQAGIGGGQVEPSPRFAGGELGGRFGRGHGIRKIVGGVGAGGELHPSARISRIVLGGGLGGLAGMEELPGCEAASGEGGPGTRGFGVEAGGVEGGGLGFFELALGKIEFAEAFGCIGVFGVEAVGHLHFLKGQSWACGLKEEAREEAVGFGILGVLRKGEADRKSVV